MCFIHHVDQRGQVNGELAENGDKCVEIEDVRQRSFSGQRFQRLEEFVSEWHVRSDTYFRSRNEQEATSEEKTLQGVLTIAEFNSVQIENTQTVG